MRSSSFKSFKGSYLVYLGVHICMQQGDWMLTFQIPQAVTSALIRHFVSWFSTRPRVFSSVQNGGAGRGAVKPQAKPHTGSPSSMLAVRIDSNLRQCMRIYEIRCATHADCRLADCRLADLQTCRLAYLQTCGLADLQTCRLADLETADCSLWFGFWD